MFNRGISRVKRLMLDNGGPEPRFDITKITAFEVTSYSALEILDNQGKMVTSEADFTKIFTKLVPEYFPTKEEKKSICAYPPFGCASESLRAVCATGDN